MTHLLVSSTLQVDMVMRYQLDNKYKIQRAVWLFVMVLLS